MPFKVLKTRVMPVGIDLGTATVKMAQIQRTNGDLELLAVAEAHVPNDCRSDTGRKLKFLTHSLRSLLKKHDFKGRKCAISLPAAETFVLHVKTAKMPPEELDQALRWELDGKLPFDQNDALISHIVVGEVHNEREAKQEVIVVAVARQVAEAYLDVAHNSRLEVVALDVEPCAIIQCFARLFQRTGDSQEATLFLDLGQAYTQVVIAHGTHLVFARNLVFGAGQINEVVGAALDTPVEQIESYRHKILNMTAEPGADMDILYSAVNDALEPVIAEITKCLRYHESLFHSHPVKRAVFLGGQAQDRRLCQRIAQRLNLSSQIGDPLARITRSDSMATSGGLDLDQAQPAWAVAVGLSLRSNQPTAPMR